MTEETIEIQAKAMGWVPQDTYNGDPDKWKDAETFVKDGYEILPILRERTKNLSAKFDETTQTLSKTQSLLEKLTEHHKKTEERAYERAMADIKADQRKAVENQDIETFDKLDKEMKKLEKPEMPDNNTENDSGFIAWKSENLWYGNRTDMAMYADSIAEFVEKRNPDLKGKPFFDKVTEEVKARFPDQFENPNKVKPDFVEGGRENNIGKKSKGKKKTYSEMPESARKFCDEMVKQGMEKDQYIKEYWELEID